MADRTDAWLKVEADSAPDADVMTTEEWRAWRDSGGVLCHWQERARRLD